MTRTEASQNRLLDELAALRSQLAAYREKEQQWQQTEAALRKSEAGCLRLYNGTPAMMHSMDRDGLIVNVNDTWLRTLGYGRDEVLGRNSLEFLSETSRRIAEETVLPHPVRHWLTHRISLPNGKEERRNP